MRFTRGMSAGMEISNTVEKQEGPWWNKFIAMVAEKEKIGRWPKQGEEFYGFYRHIVGQITPSDRAINNLSPDKALAVRKEGIEPRKKHVRGFNGFSALMKPTTPLGKVKLALENNEVPDPKDVGFLRSKYRSGSGFAESTAQWLKDRGVDVTK